MSDTHCHGARSTHGREPFRRFTDSVDKLFQAVVHLEYRSLRSNNAGGRPIGFPSALAWRSSVRQVLAEEAEEVAVKDGVDVGIAVTAATQPLTDLLQVRYGFDALRALLCSKAAV